jgi:hypothetical protein
VVSIGHLLPFGFATALGGHVPILPGVTSGHIKEVTEFPGNRDRRRLRDVTYEAKCLETTEPGLVVVQTGLFADVDD